jgi:thioesterase domain-containing protein
MFAGSIYTLATLTGWGWIYLYLLERNLQGNIVLANASIKYVAPINGIVAAKTSEELVDVKLNSIKPSKKIRIRVSVEVLSGDNVAALFSGDYVVTQPECIMENKEQ